MIIGLFLDMVLLSDRFRRSEEYHELFGFFQLKTKIYPGELGLPIIRKEVILEKYWYLEKCPDSFFLFYSPNGFQIPVSGTVKKMLFRHSAQHGALLRLHRALRMHHAGEYFLRWSGEG